MKYIFVQNRQTLLLGPMDWRQRFFQAEVNDLVDAGEKSTKSIIPPTESYLDLGEGFEIFPVVDSQVPEHDFDFDQLVGPAYTYSNDAAYESYGKAPIDINLTKSRLKDLAAAQRYIRENSVTKITVQGQEVTLDVSRDNRNIFVQKYMLMADTDTVNWKFPEGWLTLTKSELGSIVAVGAAYIQEQFDWEQNLSARIDATTIVDELRVIKAEILGLEI